MNISMLFLRHPSGEPMNLILLFQKDFTGPDTVRVSERRMEHITGIHRAQKGDTLIVGLLNGKMGKGQITAITHSFVEMKVNLDQSPPAPLPVTLVIAMPRPKMLKRILQTTASLGVKNIYLVNAWKVEKGFWSSPLLTPEKLNHHILLGLEQAKDTCMPTIHMKRLFKPFATEELPSLTKNRTALVAHPGTSTPCPFNIKNETIIALGPEGGFIDLEIETFEKAGFQRVGLGQRVLRLETAVPFILSRFSCPS